MKKTSPTRCFAPPAAWEGDDIVLSGDEAHHLARVLRRTAGAPVSVLDGAGRVADARILRLDKRHAVARIEGVTLQPRPFPRMALAQALIKGARMEWVVQKGVELGLSELIPVASARSVVKHRPGEAPDYPGRLEAIALAALKQSGNAWLPLLHEPCSWAGCLEGRSAGESVCYGALEEDAVSFRDFLRGGKAANAGVRPLLLCVGPEGDFSPEEVELLRARHAVPVSLGSLILRAETAALYMVACARYEFADLTGTG